MKMVIFEKWFINSDKHGEKIINRAEKLLKYVERKRIEPLISWGSKGG